MRQIVIKTRKEAGINLETLFKLTIDSYEQWKETGLDEPWMHRTFEEFCDMTRDTTVFVALDAVSKELLGMHCFRADKRKRRAYGYYLAVAPGARREGIASRLLDEESKIICNAGDWHLHGLTSEKATWSVNWHLRNGYRLIGYKRLHQCYQTLYVNGKPKKLYYATMLFRRQLVPVSLGSWSGIKMALQHPIYALHSSTTFCSMRYWISYLITIIVKNRKGQVRVLHLIRPYDHH